MGTKTSLSKVRFPDPTGPLDPVNKRFVDANAGGTVPLGSLYQPLTGVWPPVDATNGPLTADSAITTTAPSFTGMTQYTWNSGKFNTQSQNWAAVNTSNGVSANQVCQNTTTPRSTNYASTNMGFPCYSDFSFNADTAKIIIAYFVTPTHSAYGNVSTSNHEVQLFAEHEGQMKAITQMPAVYASGGSSNVLFYKTYTWKQAQRRGFRVMMSAGCWLQGVYIDTGGLITKAVNRPVLMSCFGDSWAEGAGNVWSSVGGNGSQAGTTWPTGCSLLYSNTAVQLAIATGFAVSDHHQGGTGYFVSNGGSIGIDDTTGNGFTVFGGQIAVDYWWNTWGSRFPTVVFRGGWNDGTAPGTPYLTNYQTRAIKVWKKCLDKDWASGYRIPLVVEGIQSKSISAGDYRDLSNQGLAAAVGSMQAAGYKALGFIDDLTQHNLVDIWSADIGPDDLHPTVKGGNNIGQNDAKSMAQLMTQRSYVNLTLAA